MRQHRVRKARYCRKRGKGFGPKIERNCFRQKRHLRPWKGRCTSSSVGTLWCPWKHKCRPQIGGRFAAHGACLRAPFREVWSADSALAGSKLEFLYFAGLRDLTGLTAEPCNTISLNRQQNLAELSVQNFTP